MTTATSRKLIRQELYNRVPGLGFVGVADSVAAGSITDAYALRDSTKTQGHYRNFYIYRPDLIGVADDDVVHVAKDLTPSTGALTQSGANYGNTAELDYELVGLLHPDEINACIQRAQRRIYWETQVPLSELTDGDMDDSGVTSWSAIGTPSTRAKTTTASKVWTGLRALRVLNDTALEGAQSVTLSGFGANDVVYVSAVVHADVGTAKLVLYNVTGSAELASVTSAQEGWTHLWLKVQLTSACEEVYVQLLGVESTADLYWNHVVLYRQNAARILAPSWLDEPHKFLKLREARYTHSVGTAQSSGGTDDAASRIFMDWQQPSMFSLDPFHRDTNPYAIQLMKPTPMQELWIEAKRPYSDVEPLSTDSATTLAPLDMVYAYCTEELAKQLKKRYPQDARWDVLLGEAIGDRDAQATARPEIPIQPMRREHWGRV